MKRIYSFLIVAVLSVTGLNAQEKGPKIKYLTNNDTLANADTVVHPLSNVGYYESARFTVGVDSLSGTVAGTAILYASLDEIDWFPLDTLTLSNTAVNKKTIVVSPANWRYYKEVFITIGTVSAAPRTSVYLIKPNSE